MSRRPKKKVDGLSYAQFRQRVGRGQLDALYLFIGAETYLAELAQRDLIESMDEVTRAFNISVFYLGDESGSGQKTRLAAALDTANELPMMSSRRVVVVHGIEGIREGEADLLLDYLNRPSDTGVVIFRAAALDSRRKTTQALFDKCTVVAFDSLASGQAAAWVGARLTESGCSFDPAVPASLVETVGTDLARLAMEANKLATFAGKERLAPAMIERLVPRAREHPGWELTDAIAAGKRPEALRIVERMLDDGAVPVMIIGTLAAHYRRLLIANELIAKGGSGGEIGRATGQSGFRLERLTRQARQTAREDLVHALKRLAQVDSAVKGGEATPRLQIEYLVAELTLPGVARWGIFDDALSSARF